ncbi:MAG: hypothetical protein ACJ762_07335 [Solirubrobacteraceae bacterium]
MRKLALPALVVLASGAAIAAAQDQPITTLTSSAKVTPTNGGTKAKPQAHKLTFNAHWETPGDVERPIVQKFVVLFPKGALYNGGKYPKCSANTMARGGTKACPKGSIMGHGTGDAYADQVITHPDITVVNGGKDKVYFYTILNNPARVQSPVLGKITKMSGKWAYKLEAKVPEVLQIVAGVPIALRDLTVTAGSTTKDWLATTSCTGGKWAYSVETFYSTGGSATYDSSTPCKK